MRWLYLLLFGGFGLVLVFVAFTSGARRWALKRRGVRAKGTVVDTFEDKSGKRSSFYPVVEFSAADGKSRRFNAGWGTSEPQYKTGTAVEVIYDRNDPAVAEFAGFETSWGGSVAALVLGLACWAAAAAIFYLAGQAFAR